MAVRIKKMKMKIPSRQRQRFRGTGNFWVAAALVVLSMTMVTTAMTFTNKRTRGAANPAEASSSNDNDDKDTSREQQHRRRHQRQIQKKSYSYENCPWSADQTIQHHFISVFDTTPTSSYMTQAQRRQQKSKQAELQKVSYPALDVMFPPHAHVFHARQRHLEDNQNNDDANAANDDAAAAANDDAAAAVDDYYQGDDDDANNNSNKKNNNDDAGRSYDDDIFTGDNEMCSQFLVNFLEGTTDARDTCEGIQNAYVAAGTLHWNRQFVWMDTIETLFGPASCNGMLSVSHSLSFFHHRLSRFGLQHAGRRQLYGRQLRRLL
jgi:hypothetical protein